MVHLRQIPRNFTSLIWASSYLCRCVSPALLLHNSAAVLVNAADQVGWRDGWKKSVMHWCDKVQLDGSNRTAGQVGEVPWESFSRCATRLSCGFPSLFVQPKLSLQSASATCLVFVDGHLILRSAPWGIVLLL